MGFWVFGVFAASYFVVLQVDGVFGVFAASWAPEVCRLLKPGSSILDHILEEILEDTADLPIYEVFSISIYPHSKV